MDYLFKSKGTVIRITEMTFLIGHAQVQKKRGMPYNYPLFIARMEACESTQGTDKPSNPNLVLEGMVYPRQDLAFCWRGKIRI